MISGISQLVSVLTAYVFKFHLSVLMTQRVVKKRKSQVSSDVTTVRAFFLHRTDFFHESEWSH